jgi:hypothetical protein
MLSTTIWNHYLYRVFHTWSPELVRFVSHTEKSLAQFTFRNKSRAPECFKNSKIDLSHILPKEL